MDRTVPRILVVASGGGHWVEALRLRDAFEGADVAWVTVQAEYASDVRGDRFHVVPDATRWNRLALMRLAARLFAIMLRERPDVVVTTGAAPGYFALRFGRWLGARTVWIDSIANAGELSLSGRSAGPYADLWLTQWEHLAEGREDGAGAGARDGRRPEYAGAVL